MAHRKRVEGERSYDNVSTYLIFTEWGILYESFDREWKAVYEADKMRARKVENIFGRVIWRLHPEP